VLTPDASSDQVTRHLLAFAELTSDLVGIVDDEGRVVYVNEAARKRLGVGDETGLTAGHLFPPEAFSLYYEVARPALLRDQTWRGEVPLLTASGVAVPMDLTLVAEVGPGGEIRTLVAYGREFTGTAAGTNTGGGGQAASAINRVTGLPTRSALEARARVALGLAREDRGVAVIVAGVDGMPDVVEAYGGAFADEVLATLARSMGQVMRTGDTVACIGSDRFAVLLEALDDTDTAWEVTERLRDAVAGASSDLGDSSFTVTAGFGLAVAEPGDSAAELLQRAEAAMARARSVGGARGSMFDADTAITVTTLADELALAVSHGLIRPHVQSVVDLETGALAGYQGLARWAHPRHGMLEADQFVHLVAGTPILPVIDLAVLRRTAAAAARSARSGAPIRAYGHLSRRLLGDSAAERYLAEIVDDLGVSPSNLGLEIAHATVARASRTVESALRTLHEIGVRLVLSGVDGECDVHEIVAHGFDEVRLDRRLVRDAARDPVRRRLAHGTIALARALGLDVIAVGIESESDREQMYDAGCRYGEGYLFGPVQPAGAVD
jgi:diguanylate cyclase (GGDEF)-like protein